MVARARRIPAAEDPPEFTHIAKAEGYLVDMSAMEDKPQSFEAYALAAIAEGIVALAAVASGYGAAPPERKH